MTVSVQTTACTHWPGIDLLRGLAASLVLAYHVVENSGWKSFPHDNPLALAVRLGWVGVDLFLVISGFVIGRAAIMAAADPQPGWRRRFMERRLRRIVPLYLLTCLLCLVFINHAVLQHGWRIAVISLGSHLGFVHNLNPYTMSSINGPNWSVALEMQFYVLAILAAPWLAGRRAWGWLLAAVCVAWAWRYLGTLVHVPGQANPHFQFHWSALLPGTSDQFACGIAVAWVSIRWGVRPSWRACLPLLALAMAVIWGTWALFFPRSGYWEHAGMITWWRSPLSLGFALLIAAVLWCPFSLPKVARPLSYVGDISYGLYLWHLLCISLLLKHTGLREWPLLIASFACAGALAAISWHALERPIIRSTRPSWWSRHAARMPFLHRFASWR